MFLLEDIILILHAPQHDWLQPLSKQKNLSDANTEIRNEENGIELC